VPRHGLKAGFDYALTDQWKVGADWTLVSSQYLFGDASNLNRPLPGYGVVNAHTSFQLTKTIELYANVQNLLNKRYYTYGTFFDTAAITFLNLKNPRTLSPAAPFVAYVGLHATF
jgi:iron complex outermembrane receptor protein